MNHLVENEKRDKTMDNGNISQEQKKIPPPPTISLSGTAVCTNNTVPLGSSDGSPSKNTSASTALPIPIGNSNLPSEPAPLPRADATTTHAEANGAPTIQKTRVLSTTAAATDALFQSPEGYPLNADGTSAPSLSLAITVPALPSVKRKSPQTDSLNNSKEALPNGKKQKIDGVSTTPAASGGIKTNRSAPTAPASSPASAPPSADIPKAPVPAAIDATTKSTIPATDPVKSIDEKTAPRDVAATAVVQASNHTTIPVVLAASTETKIPIPSFSAPPGQRTNGTKTQGMGDTLASKTASAKAKPSIVAKEKSSKPPIVLAKVNNGSKAKPPIVAKANNGSKAKHKNSNKDFVTIKVGPVESDLKKKYSRDSKDSTSGKGKNNRDTTDASSSSVSATTTTTATNKPSQPPTTASGVAPKKTTTINTDEVVSQFTTFPSLQGLRMDARHMKSLSTSERIQLERLFEFDKRKNNGKTWDDDWFGVLDLCNLDVQNPDVVEGESQKKRSLLEWVGRLSGDAKKKVSTTNNSLRLLNNLLRHVYNYKKVPEQAKLILLNINLKDPLSIGDAIQRLSIDPIVLQQDGWTTAKAKEPQGASGGAYRIGERIWWQGYLGVVIAFVHDDDMGDLWKAIWIEDLATFDLELEELDDSRKKYERKKAASTEKKKKQLIAKNDFRVSGIEHGIVLATSYARGARHGVFWPARVLHASELVGLTGRRSKNKKKVDVVFLAPYWNSDQTSGTNGAKPLLGSFGPMFEVESIDANDSCIQSYPYDAEMGLDIDSLRTNFKFLGLPKAAFSRLLDSQRIALGFKTYSQTELKSTHASESDRTSAALLEGHPLAVQAAHFPSSVLQLPFIHILSQLPHHNHQTVSQSYNDTTKGEPALRFDRILEAMKPPTCWGLEPNASSHSKETPQLKSSLTSPLSFLDKNKGTKDDPYNTGRFLIGLLSLQSLLSDKSPTSRMLKNSLNELVSSFAKNSSLYDLQPSESRKIYIKSLNKTWVVVKSKGETLIIAALRHKKFLPFIKDWRRCCERIYKHINAGLGSNGKSWVITDSRCNLHLTSSDCFERAVRLPAALKGVRQAKGNIGIMHSVEDSYLNLAEYDAIPRAHKMAYIQKIKKRCMAAPVDQVVALTDDSDGNGGEDTKGSRGTWNAALLGVGAALKGLDMIINGECLNVFCATRPPGHHAGRELHAMKAVSNGFCILNSVACAALYATTPITDGGLGLSRVCVIDIDVHHGNGTQDILCSTYDPRFLYVSMHAGGPDINGLDIEDDELDQVEYHLGGDTKKGIFPGRCGDVSPHKGVLNIPLGGRVTSHALGTALVTKVTPAVDEFNPEIIIISAGFDAHKHDPLNMGGLTAEDFGTLTEVICKLAYKCCSGRVLSVMEGGYGVPCCRPQNFANRANNVTAPTVEKNEPAAGKDSNKPKQQEKAAELQCLDLGSDLPPSMTDFISSYALQKRLDRCHQEGFVHCVKEHVSALARCNIVKR